MACLFLRQPVWLNISKLPHECEFNPSTAPLIPNFMNTNLSPIESKFATVEEAESYDRWFRAKVQAYIDDTRPSIPHGQVMAEMDAIITEAEQRLGRKQA